MTALQRRYFGRRSAPRAAAPIVIRTRSSPVRRRRFHRTRRAAGRIGGLASAFNIDMAAGGALYGYAVKSGWIAKLPAIPIVGRTGTAALLLGYWGKHGGGEWVRKAGVAAAVLAGYQLGSTGVITGDFDTAGLNTGDDYSDGLAEEYTD